MKRVFCLSFALVLLIFGCLSSLASCSEGGVPAESTDETLPPPETTYDYVLIENGNTRFQLVRSDTSETANPEIEWVRYFYNLIKEKTGLQMTIKTDWDPEDIADYEIVIGKTTREKDETGLDRTELGEKDFRITLLGNRLYLIGGSAEGTGYAVKYFAEHYVAENGTVSVPEGIDLVVRYQYPVQAVMLNGTALENYRIVYGRSGGAMVKYAAEELQRYLYQAAGITLTTVSDEDAETEHEILIGRTTREDGAPLIDRSGLGEEGFIITQKDDKLIISGGDNEKRGTLYGVYEFLEAYIGWRFFAADTEVIYPSDSISLESGLYDRQVPQFEFRDSFWKCNFNADIAVKRRINFAENHSFAEKHGGGFVYAGFVHTLGALAETGDGESQTPCLSDETVYQTVLKNVKARLDADPNAKIISVSQNDNVDKFCKCEKCTAKNTAAGSPMGSLLAFVNRIARDIAADYPDVKVDTLAYLYTLKVPNGLVPEENVIIRFCPMNACRNHALTAPNCSDNASFIEDFEAWTKICQNLYIWDYSGNHMYPNVPFPELDIIRENVRYFAEKGVTGYFMQGNMYNSADELVELKAYLAAKLLWDPYMSEEAYQNHIREFMKAYYGDGWESIKEWSDFTQEITSKTTSLHYDIYAAPTDYLSRGQFNKPEIWERFDALWDEAEKAAEGVTLSHVQKERTYYDFIRLSYIYPDQYMFGTPEQKKQYLAEARALLDVCIRFDLGIPSGADATKAPIQWK